MWCTRPVILNSGTERRAGSRARKCAGGRCVGDVGHHSGSALGCNGTMIRGGGGGGHWSGGTATEGQCGQLISWRGQP